MRNEQFYSYDNIRWLNLPVDIIIIMFYLCLIVIICFMFSRTITFHTTLKNHNSVQNISHDWVYAMCLQDADSQNATLDMNSNTSPGVCNVSLTAVNRHGESKPVGMKITISSKYGDRQLSDLYTTQDKKYPDLPLDIIEGCMYDVCVPW